MPRALSKQQILLKLARDGCNWDDLLNAWNALHEFLQLKIRHEKRRLNGDCIFTRFKGWLGDENFPAKQVSVAELSKSRIYDMTKSVCLHITNKDFENVQFEISSLPRNRDRHVDVFNDEVPIAAPMPDPQIPSDTNPKQ